MNQEFQSFSEVTNFLYPQHTYHGKLKPEYLVFNANLQKFSQRVSYVTNLQTAGKISPEEAYDQIKILWKQFKYSKKELKIDEFER